MNEKKRIVISKNMFIMYIYILFCSNYLMTWADAWYMHRIYYPEFFYNVLLIKTFVYFLLYLGRRDFTLLYNISVQIDKKFNTESPFVLIIYNDKVDLSYKDFEFLIDDIYSYFNKTKLRWLIIYLKVYVEWEKNEDKRRYAELLLNKEIEKIKFLLEFIWKFEIFINVSKLSCYYGISNNEFLLANGFKIVYNYEFIHYIENKDKFYDYFIILENKNDILKIQNILNFNHSILLKNKLIVIKNNLETLFKYEYYFLFFNNWMSIGDKWLKKFEGSDEILTAYKSYLEPEIKKFIKEINIYKHNLDFIDINYKDKKDERLIKLEELLLEIKQISNEIKSDQRTKKLNFKKIEYHRFFGNIVYSMNYDRYDEGIIIKEMEQIEEKLEIKWAKEERKEFIVFFKIFEECIKFIYLLYRKKQIEFDLIKVTLLRERRLKKELKRIEKRIENIKKKRGIDWFNSVKAEVDFKWTYIVKSDKFDWRVEKKEKRYYIEWKEWNENSIEMKYILEDLRWIYQGERTKEGKIKFEIKLEIYLYLVKLNLKIIKMNLRILNKNLIEQNNELDKINYLIYFKSLYYYNEELANNYEFILDNEKEKLKLKINKLITLIIIIKKRNTQEWILEQKNYYDKDNKEYWLSYYNGLLWKKEKNSFKRIFIEERIVEIRKEIDNVEKKRITWIKEIVDIWKELQEKSKDF